MEMRQYMVMININQSLEEELWEKLKALNIEHYTKITNTTGCGSSSEPHLGTPVWPEYNNTYFIALTSSQKEALLKELHSLKNEWKTAGVNWFLWKLERA